MKVIPIVLLSLLAVGCSKPIPPAEEGNVRSVSANDTAMQEAIATAQQTFPEFKKRLAKASADEMLAVKVKLEGPNGDVEHIWLADVKVENGRIKGVLDNDPVALDKKAGDAVDVPESQLSDWVVFKNDKVVAGGYSMKVLGE